MSAPFDERMQLRAVRCCPTTSRSERKNGDRPTERVILGRFRTNFFSRSILAPSPLRYHPSLHAAPTRELLLNVQIKYLRVVLAASTLFAAGLLKLRNSGHRSRIQSRRGRAIEHFRAAGMQERARLIGADLELDSEPGQGTSVRVRTAFKKAFADEHSGS